MQIVIDISKEDYNRIKDIPEAFNSLTTRVYKSIKNGTPLPKGHGRLIDGDKAIADFANYGIDHMWDAFDLPDIIDNSPTIIEADKGSDSE